MKDKTRILTAGLLAIMFILTVALFVRGDPVGGEIQLNFTSYRSVSPDNRSDEGGTINTINVQAVQQNAAWKAYVGNISGSLVLDDSSDKSIFEWSLSSLTGEILASRSGSLTWSSLSCASEAVLLAEHSALNMGQGDVDNINKTFSWSNHKTFTVAGNTLTGNSCSALGTYINDTAQADSATAYFQEILVNDSSSNLIYVAELETNLVGYNNVSTFDFQMLVADNDQAGQITTYYFYVELDS